MVKPTLYIETSVISYLVAKPSRDIIVAANQQVTHEWWEQRLDDYDAYVSDIVIREAKEGNKEYAQKRLDAIKNLTNLEMTTTVVSLSNHIIDTGTLPTKAKVDALHIAISSFYHIQYLITWNCKHIANAHIRSKIESVCKKFGYNLPTICTPLEFLGEEAHVD